MKHLIFIKAPLIFLSFLLNIHCAFSQNWNSANKITALDRAANDQFGISVSISGDFAVVGSRYEDEDSLGLNTIVSGGSAYIYRIDSLNNWNQIQKIVASDRTGSDQFGWAVNISGDFIAISSIGQDFDELGANSLSDAGAVYIFENNGFDHWLEVQKLVASDRGSLDWFGASMDLDSNRLIVGSYQEDHDTVGLNTLNNSGSAYVFERNGGGVWSEIIKLVASDRGADDNFGFSVAINGNNAIVGSRYEDEDSLGLNTLNGSGSAYIFEEITPSQWVQTQKLSSSDRASDDYFGWTLDMEGDLAVIGAYGEDHDELGANFNSESGSAYIFRRNSFNDWLEESKIVATDRNEFDYFTRSISIFDSTIVIGAYQEDENEVGLSTMDKAGSAYIYDLDTNGNWTQTQKIVSTDRFVVDQFGYCVGVSGDRILIGANREDEDSLGNNTMNSSGSVYFYNNRGVGGYVYLDLDQDCQREQGEVGLQGRMAIINPGNIIVETNEMGHWHIDSLPIGSYTITIDTSGNWFHTCSIIQSFDVLDPAANTLAPNFGMISLTPCTNPDVSISMPIIRPCFSDLKIHINVSNNSIATAAITSPVLELKLDSSLTILTSPIPYTPMGNDIYQINLNDLVPGANSSFTLESFLSCDVQMGQSICLDATLIQIDSCFLDTIPGSTGGANNSCLSPYDQSSLEVDAWCTGDSLVFTIKNNGPPGTGDMSCYSPTKLYIDGQAFYSDSVLLAGGEIDTLNYAGDGRTWRLEVLQHPKHPGNSFPNKTIELCGDENNWTSDLFNLLPHDDFNPNHDIYCGIATGSYDPNDKTPYPGGIGDSNYVYLDQNMEYRIRFQNTGTDTAFTVIIRDTLDFDFDIFSVVSGASSHSYSFEKYGPRVLQWTFNNILLPDSTTNEVESHGFVHFKVQPLENSPEGTILNNTADIYFDFNEPIITNTTLNVLNDFLPVNEITYDSISMVNCGELNINGFDYIVSGVYYQFSDPMANDTLLILDLLIDVDTLSTETISTCDSYFWPSSGIEYNSSGTYTETFINVNGCDSTAILELIINSDTLSSENIEACQNYTWNANGITYTTGGIYTEILQNTFGCDSTAILYLTINADTLSIESIEACQNYTWNANGVTYTTGGIYTEILQNTFGCDSTAILNLTINADTLSIENIGACQNYTWNANGITYTTSGIYTEILQNTFGCDSTAILNLTINADTLGVENIEACQNYTWNTNGVMYTTSGIYTEILQNTFGCDSTAILNLTINADTLGVENIEACQNYTWNANGNTYTMSGTYTEIVQNTFGCDSIAILELTINNLNDSIIFIDDITLSAISSGLQYQWLDCDDNYSPISLETSQSFTALENGNYAVSIIDNNCSDTSDCLIVSSVEQENLIDIRNIKVMPNPTNGLVSINLGDFTANELSVSVVAVDGKIISLHQFTNANFIQFDLKAVPGVYFLKINIDQLNYQSFKIIKN
ncbi:MAG: putative repeat protein (TIGR01451 family) [Crocinitomicaceae bacterium]|jgi:uncharacterized repeat protein (TIGR01451 family)